MWFRSYLPIHDYSSIDYDVEVKRKTECKIKLNVGFQWNFTCMLNFTYSSPDDINDKYRISVINKHDVAASRFLAKFPTRFIIDYWPPLRLVDNIGGKVESAQLSTRRIDKYLPQSYSGKCECKKPDWVSNPMSYSELLFHCTIGTSCLG